MNSQVSNLLQASTYKKDECSIGIVHVGYGAFHRAHQAFYIDQYMEKTGDLNWGIAGVNLRGADSNAFAQASTNEEGYVVKTMSADNERQDHLLRAHLKFVDWSTHQNEAQDLVKSPSVKLITMTVTESGYYLDSEGTLDEANDVISSEINGTAKSSIYAYLKGALTQRMDSSAGPITILSCDNIRHNGHVLEKNFKLYLKAVDDAVLLSWVENNASFPACMVDRITPKPDPEHSVETEQLFGIKNSATVLAEDFIQWVIEDNFKSDFPKLDTVGVTITKDVEAYEETKIRVLNGGHTCLTYLGALEGFETYDEALADPKLREHFNGFEAEVLPALPDYLPFSKTEYLAEITKRFSNKYISDSIERICTDGFNKFPIFILPTIKRNFEMGIEPSHAIRSIASWYVFSNKIYNGSMKFNYIEPYSEHLKPLLGHADYTPFVSSEMLWGSVAVEYPRFKEILKSEIKALEQKWPL